MCLLSGRLILICAVVETAFLQNYAWTFVRQEAQGVNCVMKSLLGCSSQLFVSGIWIEVLKGLEDDSYWVFWGIDKIVCKQLFMFYCNDFRKQKRANGLNNENLL